MMQADIERARAVALQVLQPRPAELEHGLELHAASVVVDAYGFAPHFAPDPAVLRAAAEDGAAAAALVQLDEEERMIGGVADPARCRRFMSAWEAAGVDCIVQNAGREGNAIPRLLQRLARFTFLTDVLRDSVRRAVAAADITAAAAAGQRSLFLSLNGVPLPLELDSVGGELAAIRVFFQLGARMAHLTYNRRNLIGDGCGEARDAGLSDFGRAVVAEMNRVGMLVDVAHSGPQTSLDAARVSGAPMCASHTVCASLNAHIRAKPDEVLRAIADTGGIVGICCVPGFLGGAADISALLDHVEHVVKTVGVDVAAIGSDTGYHPPAAEPDTAPARRRTWPGWEMLWPGDSFPYDPQYAPRWERQMQTLAWTNWPLFTVGLVQRGYSDDEVCKIIGGNVLRVIRDASVSRSQRG